MANNVRDDFYELISKGKRREAYDFLMANPAILRDLTIRDISKLYTEFDNAIPIGEIRGLANLIMKEASGREGRYVVIG